MMSYNEWCVLNNCDHAHCPDRCQKPQPFVLYGVLFCGRCWFKYGEMVAMIPCTPDNCGE